MSNLGEEKIKNLLKFKIQADMRCILSKQPILEAGHLTITSEWLLMDTARIFDENPQIGECAWTYLVLYLLAKEIQSFRELELVSWTCLSLASRKFNQNISLKSIIKSINFRSDIGELLKTHLNVYQEVKDHKICLVSDVISCLLELISYPDIVKIRETALIFSKKAYRDCIITSLFTAGLAAVLWALEQLQLEDLQVAFNGIQEIKQEIENARQLIRESI